MRGTEDRKSPGLTPPRGRRSSLRMRKINVVLVGLLAAAAVAAPSASAGNAHFIKNATSASLSGSSLVCKFKEAGLESGSVETVTCSATETIVYECVNNGGKNPAASNKKTFVTTASVSG